MVKFSQRKGFTPVSNIIQTNGISQELRNSLWSIIDICLWQDENFMYGHRGSMSFDVFTKVLWLHFFKKPIDTRGSNMIAAIREYFFKCEWYEVYDFLEFTLNVVKKGHLDVAVNSILERDISGYRYINGVFTDITSKEEIEMLEEALTDTDYPGVKAHLQRALELLSHRENPDYRNSIKESISAVESVCREITGNKKATLGDALKVIERMHKLHPALKDAFSKLYGYTSDESGIRHAMLDEPDLGSSEAKFFLMTCTSFINYIKSKIDNPN